MTGFFSPNLPILSKWQETFKVAFQKLRRTNFVIDNTFEWQDFDPQIDYQGMTVTGVANRIARYVKINKCLYVSLSLQATLAAPLATVIYVTIPGTAPNNTDGNTVQGGTPLLYSAGAAVLGRWFLFPGFNKLEIAPTAGAWGAGLMLIYLNTILEIQ